MAHYTDYRIAVGHNKTGGWYGTPDPQPRALGIKAGRRTMAGDGLFYQDGFPSTTWHFTFFTKDQYSDFLDMAGLGDGTPSAFVTIRTPHNYDRAFRDYNATIIMPDSPDEARYEMTRWQDIEFQIVKMVDITA